MAQIEKLIPLIFKWERGYVNDPVDRGGPTKMGVTLKT
jgi:lysozyme family protein